MKIFFFCPTLLFFACVTSSSAWGEKPDTSASSSLASSSDALPTNCAVRVRAIKGDTHNPEGIKRPVTSGPMLKDLTKHLQALPYDHYRVLDVKEQPVPFGTVGEFKLAGEKNQTYELKIHPQSMVHRRIQLLVQWIGPHGESLLSSKLRVENGKNVVVGTDEEGGDTSTMFCIFLNCT